MDNPEPDRAMIMADWKMLCEEIGVRLADFARDRLKAHGLYVQLKTEVVPFADHFPFSVFGVPSLWFFRENFPGGRWQHHSAHDNLENVSVNILMEIVSAVSRLICDTARLEKLPFEKIGREILIKFTKILISCK